ncbi:IS1634 family transposase [Candidatus Brocadia sinica]|uniref:IS1634 family transposase n=1 Tax=Candidatus Brocadia sinica TaxID=795830 RepID=UPI000696C36D|nr:IS1634 family transposase [Candidatus Brocadia sinica]NOG41744.1 IS1634 family transposase [Planctomycetota bacterium]
MFLREKTRTKDGKTHRYWSVVENRRISGGRVVQRQVLYLGELNDNQRAGWVRTIEAVAGEKPTARQVALFPDDREALPIPDCETVQVRLDKIELRCPRQWGASWLGLYLWDMLELDIFWRSRLPSSRKGTSWLNMLKALVCYWLIDPGSEFRFHREWYVRSAMGDLLGEDDSLAQKDKLYRCLDLLLEHRDELFGFLKGQWGKLFGAKYDVLLYDLTSTYFESEPPAADAVSKKRFGYSRDKRSDCVQVVVALVLTPEGFPVAYEVYPGNTRDTATLEEFLDRIEKRYGKFRRTWLMDRGIPTEEVLEKMRERGIDYLVGTPKGHLTRVEKPLLEQTWMQARESVRVKILQQESEFYVYVESQDRVAKERSMRRRRLRRLWAGLRELRNRKVLTRDDLLMHIGALKKEAGRDFRLVNISIPKPQEPVNENTFRFSLDRERLRQAYRREGRYLLRSNMQATAPETVWENYLLLTRIEQAFKDLKGSLSIRPIWHQLERRIEAHIFVSFLAFCLHTTLRNLARGRAAGLTSEAILEKLSSIQMIDVHLPTTDGRHIVMSRYTQPEKDVVLLLAQLGLMLPEQPPPKIYASG